LIQAHASSGLDIPYQVSCELDAWGMPEGAEQAVFAPFTTLFRIAKRRRTSSTFRTDAPSAIAYQLGEFARKYVPGRDRDMDPGLRERTATIARAAHEVVLWQKLVDAAGIQK
jgi:hypothetical protein